jgi:transketolase
MDIVFLTKLLAPCLPYLLKLGGIAAEKTAEKAGETIAPDIWEKANKIWSKLGTKVESKEELKVAAEQVAAKPESPARQAVFQEELEILLKENPNLAEEIAKILQEEQPTATGVQINQTVTNNEGQAIGQMSNSKAIGRIDGNIQGGVNF